MTGLLNAKTRYSTLLEGGSLEDQLTEAETDFIEWRLAQGV